MSAMISWNLQTSVKDGRLEDARALAAEMVDSTKQESGTLGYEWYLSDDGSRLHINERFADSDAAMVHMGAFGARYAARFTDCVQPTSLSVYGEPSDELRSVLDGIGAVYHGPLDGFQR